MSDFAPGAKLQLVNFTATQNADGSISVTVNFNVTGISGTVYTGQTQIWNPAGAWPAMGDLQSDLKQLAILAVGAARAQVGL